MRLLSLAEVLRLHEAILGQSGGSPGLRDLGALESAVAQPTTTFDGSDLYPTLEEKAAALCFSLASNHPFIDGNKRVAHAAMEALLMLNGLEIRASLDEQERVMLALASSKLTRDELLAWLREHVVPSKGPAA
jgi:death-on-curing protein